jgi:hypothetical protein
LNFQNSNNYLPPSSEVKKMRLSYRGVNYETELPILEANEGEIGGKYRGRDWNYRYPKHIPQLKPKFYQQYRGIAYSTRPIPKDGEIVFPQWNATGVYCPISLQQPQTVVSSEVSKTHLENMRRSLERRLEIAKENGDESLLELLKKESRQLALES